MKTSSLRIVVLVAIFAPFLVFHPTIARAATVTVKVGNGGFFFTPSSVTIHTGDTVVWTLSSSGHSSTSGSPGMPNGLWDSGILNQGATFMHTFNTAGSFSYYCTAHGACCGMVGTVNVSNSTPTPSPTATPTPTPASRLGKPVPAISFKRAQALSSPDSSSPERARKQSCFAGSVRP